MPLHARLAAELRRRIETGELAVGALLPSEASLCAETRASRGTVRQALATLRADGLIGGGQGKRPVVLDVAPAQPFASFVSFTRWAREIGREPGQRTYELGTSVPEPAVAAALRLDPRAPAVRLVRLRLLDGVPAMIERATFAPDVGRMLLEADPDAGSIYTLLVERGSVDLRAVRHTLEAVAADVLDAQLLAVPVGTPLLRDRRLACGPAGEPRWWSDERYRPGVATVAVTNTRAARSAMTRQAP